ncbi:MAG: SpoIID/LytB domain-containing protein [Leptospiraceae bacterium]|nr:SpoIID/LytB domain-containing protein [Leptospiraceae bacterium]MCP5498317.1 SpoIID/LytB domain-containing protein [Leptospiraceae bacterium]
MNQKTSFFLLFLISILFFSSCRTNAELLETYRPKKKYDKLIARVLLAKSQYLHLSSSGKITARDEAGKVLWKTKDYLNLNFPLEKTTILEFASERFQYSGKEYRGKLLLKPDEAKFLIINLVDFENYLLSVVPAEMPASWPIEALKAQAICARTYALRAILTSSHLSYDLEGNTYSQAYGGIQAEHESSTKAVLDTKGIILLYKNEPLDALYHSNAGGITEDAESVWSNKLEYVKTGFSKFDYPSKAFYWKYSFSLNELQKKFDKESEESWQSLQITKASASGRVLELEAKSEGKSFLFSGKELRLSLGTRHFRSLKFYLVNNGREYTAHGFGFGHGVGLSQWGSYNMAKVGFDYKEILRYYYQNFRFASLEEKKN